VASAIVASAEHPERERIVGGAGRLAAVMEMVAPRRFERVNRRYVDRLQFAVEPAPATDGNLYAPRLRRPRPGPRRLAAPTRPPGPSPPVGHGRTACRRLDHHRPDRHPLRPNLMGSNRDYQYGRGCRGASRNSYVPYIVRTSRDCEYGRWNDVPQERPRGTTRAHNWTR
jgi:hypothetical protein